MSKEFVYDSIVEYTEHQLMARFTSGEIESIKEHAENNSSAIGRLLELLAERKILNAQNIATIVDDYANGKRDEVEFIDE